MDPRIETVIKLMEGNFGHDLALQQMAQSAHLSSSRLRHLLKAETGTTPTRYLRSLRMQHAKELLETTFLTVKEIATIVGVHGESHFVHEFKRAYGSTPAQYRETYRRLLVTNESVLKASIATLRHE